MLIESAWIKRIPWIKFSYNSKMDEPIMLQHFMDTLRSMSRNSFADCGPLNKFAPPFLILFNGSEPFQF